MGRPLIDITGNRYGYLVVVEYLGKHNNQYMWLTQCDCGNTRVLNRYALEYDQEHVSCGCKRKEHRLNKIVKNEIGNTYGELYVIKQLTFRGGEMYWLCECSCGNTTEVRGSHLRNGSVRSCGCKAIEWATEKRTIHGMSGTSKYAAYQRRKRRKLESMSNNWSYEQEQFLRHLFPCCVICGITESEHRVKYNQSLHIDHIRPLKDGNGLSIENAVPLCADCNRKKQAKQLEELPEISRNKILQASELFQLLWNGTHNEFCNRSLTWV